MTTLQEAADEFLATFRLTSLRYIVAAKTRLHTLRDAAIEQPAEEATRLFTGIRLFSKERTAYHCAIVALEAQRLKDEKEKNGGAGLEPRYRDICAELEEVNSAYDSFSSSASPLSQQGLPLLKRYFSILESSHSATNCVPAASYTGINFLSFLIITDRLALACAYVRQSYDYAASLMRHFVPGVFRGLESWLEDPSSVAGGAGAEANLFLLKGRHAQLLRRVLSPLTREEDEDESPVLARLAATAYAHAYFRRMKENVFSKPEMYRIYRDERSLSRWQLPFRSIANRVLYLLLASPTLQKPIDSYLKIVEAADAATENQQEEEEE